MAPPTPGDPGLLPNPAPQAPPGLDTFANTFLSWMKWGALFAGAVGLIVIAFQMTIGRRNRNQLALDAIMGIPYVFGALAIVGTAVFIVETVYGL